MKIPGIPHVVRHFLPANVLKLPVRWDLQSNDLAASGAGLGNQDDGKQDIRKCLRRMYTRTTRTRNSHRQSVRQRKETKPKQSSSATACNCLSLQHLVAYGSLKSTFCTDKLSCIAENRIRAYSRQISTQDNKDDVRARIMKMRIVLWDTFCNSFGEGYVRMRWQSTSAYAEDKPDTTTQDPNPNGVCENQKQSRQVVSNSDNTS